jgi:ribosome maturation protein SDO1
VFTNVPKGQVAKKDDWAKAFGTEDMNKVIEEVSRTSKTLKGLELVLL